MRSHGETVNGISIPEADDARTLRVVELSGTKYVLHTWDTYCTDRMGKSQIGYAFYHVEEDEPIFCGVDFFAPACHAIDSDEVLRSLLGFLTLGKGDTDREYFDNYTPRQIEFRDGSDREYLSMWTMEGEDAESYAFEDRADRW